MTGLQDASGEVHPGRPTGARGLAFDIAATVRGDASAGPPVVSGPCCHGPPAARFLYLSWKRMGEHGAPWA